MTPSLNLTYDEIAAVIQRSYDGILVIDANAEVVLVNDAYFRITGLKKEDIVGRNFRDFIKDSPYKKAACVEALEQKLNITQTHTNLLPGKVIMVTASPIMDQRGKVRFVVSNCRDVSEMAELRGKLEKAQEMEEIFFHHFGGKPTGPIAVNSRMKELLASTLKVSTIDVTVLITGESGVGKEVFAHYIHDNSSRKDAAFVAVNCGAIPEQLLESEFFGYVGGAFTGASKNGKKGLFETANGGTLFLDEIGDLPFNLQVKLLRALDAGEITRVGANTPTPVNVRILAATNKDLERMVEEHEFREDLYYRLNVVNLHIPPLRERPEDIRPLCIYFLHECNQRYGLKKKFSTEVLQKLESYGWPGNIRELKHAIERLVVLSHGEFLELSSLPCYSKHKEDNAVNPAKAITINEPIPIPLAVEEIEKQLLMRAMKANRSSRQIAKVTGIDQTTVLRKMKKYGLCQE